MTSPFKQRDIQPCAICRKDADALDPAGAV